MYQLQNDRVTISGRTLHERGEAICFLRGAATRSQRNNGLIRGLERALVHSGSCRFEGRWEIPHVGVSMLAITIREEMDSLYSVRCRGPNADIALLRANRYQAAPDWKRVRKAICKKTPAQAKPEPPRIPRLQYPNHDINWDQAVEFIAYALRRSRLEVRGALRLRPTSGKYQRYRIEGADLPMEIELLDASPSNTASVRIYCVKDNRHSAYRRLRSALRWEFHVSAEDKKRRRREQTQIRNFFRLQRRLLLVSG